LIANSRTVLGAQGRLSTLTEPVRLWIFLLIQFSYYPI